jgi:hypothetical protein
MAMPFVGRAIPFSKAGTAGGAIAFRREEEQLTLTAMPLARRLQSANCQLVASMFMPSALPAGAMSVCRRVCPLLAIRAGGGHSVLNLDIVQDDDAPA